VGEVAELVGYADLFQFSKLFKKYFGLSPRSWRESAWRTGPR
jgi:AraC-like DNA-binding protein